MVFSILLLVVVYNMSKLFSMELMECLLSSKSCANLDLLFAFL
jgi:hypothetical protein